MKNLLFIIFCLSSFQVFAQSKFVIDGKTNALVNGKAIITLTSPDEFYPFKIKKDTVLIRNHSFTFTGKLKYPERFRIQIADKDDDLTEPFFISAGYHKINIDTASNPHDSLEVGIGVTVRNDPTNDEYIKKFLPLYNHVSEQYNDYERAKSKCNSIKDHKAKKGCVLAAEAEGESIRQSSNNVLLNYAKANPKSPIVPWLLEDAIFHFGYTDCYQNVFNEFAKYTPDNINVTIKKYLAKQKLKSIGYPFLLTDFIKSNASKKMYPSRYILVDFWFSGCAPCIAQFGQLKNIYKKFHNKGFEIAAVSVDAKGTIPKYKKLIAANHYVWPQVLDLNGVKTKTMDINAFPSGFLLDSNWKIVKTRINPDILNSFLEDHL